MMRIELDQNARKSGSPSRHARRIPRGRRVLGTGVRRQEGRPRIKGVHAKVNGDLQVEDPGEEGKSGGGEDAGLEPVVATQTPWARTARRSAGRG